MKNKYGRKNYTVLFNKYYSIILIITKCILVITNNCHRTFKQVQITMMNKSNSIPLFYLQLHYSNVNNNKLSNEHVIAHLLQTFRNKTI